MIVAVDKVIVLVELYVVKAAVIVDLIYSMVETNESYCRESDVKTITR